MTDIRYALRTFARAPLFALTAIVSLATGISRCCATTDCAGRQTVHLR